MVEGGSESIKKDSPFECYFAGLMLMELPPK